MSLQEFAPGAAARTGGRQFPYLASGRGSATPASRARFFATAPFAVVGRTDDGSVTAAMGGPFHAKAMGTLRTACGRPALSWVKLWDVPFSASLDSLCLECAEIARRVDLDGFEYDTALRRDGDEALPMAQERSRS